jgi:hypothetical protein
LQSCKANFIRNWTGNSSNSSASHPQQQQNNSP